MCKNGSLLPVLDLGLQPHSDHFPTKEQLNKPTELYPLRLVFCNDCGLLQIDYLVSPKILYQTDYVYQSLSTTKTGSAHFENLAKNVCKEYSIPKGALAVDIGSNVGSLLQCFKNEGLRVQGVDPAEEMARTAIKNGIPTIIDFFNTKVAEQIIARNGGKAHVITGTNVFAHIHDIDNAVTGMKKLLADDGVIVVEAPYVRDLIEHMEYDTIYHSHVGYLAVKPMERYSRRMGLELFALKKSDMHGGSLQYYIGHTGRHPISSDINHYIEEEETYGLYDYARLKKFAEDVLVQKKELVELLLGLKKEGKRIVGISAPAKGNTLLNYCGIDNAVLDFITEKNPLKVGRYTPGTRIPIYGDEKLLEEQPDYALILAWNFAKEIIKNLEEFKKRGGRFIVPVPKPEIY
ncbi:MAG: class I SAM-dependent methyltransferase [Parcubacteria group bacterium]|nr:class I SAM-dependent methyltransferase [Parcubacteria group bacterium]